MKFDLQFEYSSSNSLIVASVFNTSFVPEKLINLVLADFSVKSVGYTGNQTAVNLAVA
jgi:hypothetical protein